jgi:hypothetical protein
MVNDTHTIKNIDHPLDKILKGIPAGSMDFTPASVTHYLFRHFELEIGMGLRYFILTKEVIVCRFLLMSLSNARQGLPEK